MDTHKRDGEGEREEEALGVAQAWKRKKHQREGKKSHLGLVPVSFLQNKRLKLLGE